ncbi:3-oxo-tetronate kinase [Thalassospira sp.]|uniref:3-oxo-tetronate kinase n=1 Tax=Thalassospira sp. TaxID=1912094 RepID=UPI003AA80A9D
MTLLGCIADDLTGATDIALNLVRNGMKTVQVAGVPESQVDLDGADAVVVALKSRTIPARAAVEQSLNALDFLLSAGAEQIFFKYCSTFDSTDQGNIGPVLEALQHKLACDVTIACPAFPEAGRSLFQGHLFVNGRLLSESSLRDHPLTPMRDPDLVKVLQRQSGGQVGLVPWEVVRTGHAAIAQKIEAARTEGKTLLIVDAIVDDDLRAIGQAVASHKLLSGGSGLAIGLPENFRRAGKLHPYDPVAGFDYPSGAGAILAGSCSAATREQIKNAITVGFPALQLDPFKLAKGSAEVQRACDWLSERLDETGLPPLVYSTASPDEVRDFQVEYGRDRAGKLVEEAHKTLARHLFGLGVRRFMVAGGETSGAVVEALGVPMLEIGPEIAPGVPWTRSIGGDETVALALKSGNFGDADFFSKAWGMSQQ